MGEGNPKPLGRRVPGAARSGPAEQPSKVLPDAIIARIRAAVDAAHGVEDQAEAATDPLPPEPDAVDHLAESYATADPDLSASDTDQAWWEETVRGIARPRNGPQEPRRALEPARSASKPPRAPGWERDASMRQSPKPASPLNPEPTLRSGRPASPEYLTGPIPVVSLQRPPQAAAEPAGSEPIGRRRRGRLMVGAAALVTVLVAGGVVALVLPSRHHHSASARNVAAILAASDRAHAATWLVAQVSHHVKVACDPVMCRGLIQQGFPSGEVVQVIHRSPYPPQSAVVVMTPALKHLLGAGFGGRWAPGVLAEFGGGASRVTVRVIAPHGAAAYEAALSAGLNQRIFVGTNLVTSSHISIVPVSKQAIVAGLVDPRILSVIVALAAQHPVNVLAFGTNFPGTTPGTPFRTVVFAETVPASGLSPARYAAFLLSLLRSQSAEYRPARITTVRLPSGRPGLEVQYTGPSPLGLLRD